MSGSEDNLLARALDGVLDEAEVADFSARLAKDPLLAKRWIELASLRPFLRDAVADEESFLRRVQTVRRSTGQTDRFVGKVLSRAGQRRRRPPAHRTSRRYPLAILLAACLAVGLGLFWLLGRPARVQARVTATAEMAMVQRAGTDLPLAAGMELLAQDVVRLPASRAGGLVQLRYPDGTEIILLADSEIRLWTEEGASRIRLERGGLHGTVAHQPTDRPMRFITPQAEAVVRGTQLDLAVVGTATRLEVTEGSVELIRTADMHVLVRAGEFAVAQDGVELRAEARTARTAEAEPSRWSDGFEDLSAWGQEPFGSGLSLTPESERTTVHGGAQALRLRYHFPDAAPGASFNDQFFANYRSVARPITVPPGAKRLRLWLNRVSAAPQAWLILRLRDADSIWDTKPFHVADCPAGWQAVDLDLSDPPSCWRRGAGDIPAGTPVDPGRVTHLVLVAGGGDFDIIVDDAELSAVP